MKMRYIIFTAVLMCLLSVEGKGQTAILISDRATNETLSRIECVYGESLTENYKIHVPYNNGYYVEGTLYFAYNGDYDRNNPHTDKAIAKMVIGANTPYNENGLQLDFIVMQKINHDDKKKYRFWFVPSSGSTVPRGADELSINILPRPIKINPNSYDNNYSSKIYDGGTTVKDGFITNFKPNTYYSTDNTKSGILEADKEYVSFDIKSAAYKNKNCAGEKNSEIEVEFQNDGLLGGVSGNKAGNYQLIFESEDKKIDFPGTITQKALTLELNFEREYNGTTDVELTNQEFSHTTNNDIVDGEIIKILSVKGNVESANASATSKSVTIDNNTLQYDGDVYKNYSITFNATATINKQTLSLNLADNFTYESSQIGSDIVFNKPKNTNNEEVEGSFKLYDKNNNNAEVTYSDGYNLPAGDYEVVFTPNSTNYAEVKKTFKVNPKILTLNIEFEKTYDGNKSASTSYKSGYSFSGKNFSNERVGIQSLTAEFENKDVSDNEQNVTVSNIVLDNQNYAVADFTGKGKIKKKKLEIKFSYAPKTYDGTTTVNGFSYTLDGFVDASETNVIKLENEITANYEDANASDANKIINLNITNLNLTGNGAGNYEVIMPNPLSGAINRRSTSINLSYTKDKIYDATTTVLDFNGVINNLIDADKNLINVSAEYEDKNVGDDRFIDFTISALESFKQNYAYESAKIYNSNDVEIGHLDANCSLQFNNAADCIGKISQCEITINSTQNITKPYDGTTDVENFTVIGFSVAGNDNSVTFSPTTDYSLPEIEGKIYANEKIKITPTAEYNSKNVSEANEITITGTVDNDNYKVVPRKIEPATITPSVVTVTQNKKPTKTYDGDNSVKSFSDCYEVNGIFKNAQGKDEVRFLYNDASIKYTSVNAGTNIALDFSDANIRLEPVDNNYTLSVGEFYGNIDKIKPEIKWYRSNPETECEGSVSMSYGNAVGSGRDLYAQIHEVAYREKYLSEIYTYADNNGQTFKELPENGILPPGEYTVKVNFKSNDNNYKDDYSTLTVKIGFEWHFGRQFQTPENYGAKIGEDIYFYCTSTGIKESDLTYTYYLDNEEVQVGYIPKVGVHSLSCKVKHPRLGEYQVPEPIEFTIVPKVIPVSQIVWAVDKDGNILRRYYDGTNIVYDNQVVENAEIDKDLIITGDDVEFSVSMTYDDSEVGDHDVNIKYSLTGADSYCYELNSQPYGTEYTIPGVIKRCPAFVGFKEYDKVYGSSELGKDIVPTTTYVRYKGEKISPEGTCVFEVLHDGNELREYESGKMMNVGVYYMRVKFTPEDQLHYEDGRSNFEYVKVTQKSISATGVTIEDKYYDGTAKVSPVKVKLFDPELDGVIEQDKNNVKLEITNLQDIKYPDVKIGDYQGLVVKVALKGSGIENYKLTNSELKANSSILPFEFHYNVEPDETGVYQFVYGSSVMGKDFKLINELTETQTVRYKISNIDKTNQMLVPNTYKVDVQLYDSDMLVQSQQVTVNVVKLKLLTTVPNIAHAKLHDGTVSVKLTGERCVLTNVVEGDQVEIEKQEQFYDSPDLGTGKTITVSFTLSGAWHSKYIEPDNYVYNDGVITNKNIQIGSVGISGDICPSSNAPIVFDVVEGIPDKASIKFSAEALENGFEDITITNTQFGLNSVELKIPEKAKAGEYTATLYLSSGSDNNFEKVFKFTVNYDASYIISKFSDVVAINNAGYDFVGYQWYKDGHVIETETKQFFNDLPCLYGWYSAKVLTVDGTYANICPRYFDKRTAVSKRANAGVNVYPNPALPMQAVTVELEDFEDYENCTIFIYNLSGVLITKIQNPDRLNTLNLPQGSYTGVVVKDDSRLTFKLIVRK